MFKFLNRGAQSSRPNVVMVTLDMIRADMLDRFDIFQTMALHGVLCPETITYAPYTIASLHAIHTGMYGSANGVNAYYKPPAFDNRNCVTLAQYLKEHGYATRADLMANSILPHQGFDQVEVHDEFKEDLTARHRRIFRETAAGARPFFLYLHCSNVHTHVVTDIIKKIDDFDPHYFSNRDENRTRYLRYVQTVSDYLNGLFAEVDAAGLRDQTLFVFYSDHGCSLGEKPGEKAYGIFCYDYTAKVFVYFLHPTLVPQGTRVNSWVRTIDIMPTVLEILGIAQRRMEKPIQGRSIAPLWRGEESGDREAYIETGGLDGPHPSGHEPNVKAVRTRAWKLIVNTTTQARELYDLANDPDESSNLWGSRPDIEQRMWERYMHYQQRTPEMADRKS